MALHDYCILLLCCLHPGHLKSKIATIGRYLKAQFFVIGQLHDKYQDFVTASERDELSAKLQEVEDWLYEDGEDETKGVYIAKLEELKKVL